MASKQYGLILKGKAATSKSAIAKGVASAFADDSSDEDGADTKAVVSGGTDWMKRKLSAKNAKSGATGTNTKIKVRQPKERHGFPHLDMPFPQTTA